MQGQRLVLDRYHYERRYATTQEFRTTKFYDRTRGPGEEYGDWAWLDEDGVPWDEELQSQALGELMSRVQVVRQGDLSATGPQSPSMPPSAEADRDPPEPENER